MLTKVMRPHRYDLHGHKIKYPCYLQPKLNGVRCFILVNADSTVAFYSRNFKEFKAMQAHKELIKSLADAAIPGTVYDCELYIHGESLQNIVSAVKRSSVLTCKLQANIFDIVSEEPLYYNRLLQHAMFLNSAWFKVVGTVVAGTEQEMLAWRDIYVDRDKYEGIILRNMRCPYINGQSFDVQKVKPFYDSEFVVVGYTSCTKGGIIFTCKVGDGDGTFNVKPVGTMGFRRSLLANADTHIGKLLTVQYTNLSDSGVPLCPIGLTLRDYE